MTFAPISHTRRSASRRNARLAACVAAASMTLASTAAWSAVTCFSAPVTIPATTAGIYVNLFTGAANVATASVVGWDFNPWGTSGLFLYVNNAAGAGALVVGPGTTISALSAGTLISAASTFGTDTTPPDTDTSLYRAGVTPSTFLGLRFVEGGSTYYGWMALTTTAPTGHPATINRWCFENTPNTGIVAGTTPVALQKFSVE